MLPQLLGLICFERARESECRKGREVEEEEGRKLVDGQEEAEAADWRWLWKKKVKSAPLASLPRSITCSALAKSRQVECLPNNRTPNAIWYPNFTQIEMVVVLGYKMSLHEPKSLQRYNHVGRFIY